MRLRYYLLTVLLLPACAAFSQPRKPNVILIYTDDVGYGDVGCYGARNVKTPNIDQLAANGLLFTDAHATSATCTPSRYSLLSGEYAWRKKGTGIAPGDAPLLLDPAKPSMASVFKNAGYETAVIGKWHLGLGAPPATNWNGEIKPGPIELGFNTSFILPATLDRVPTIYVDGHHVVNLDPADPITIDYKNRVGNWPTGADNPELLKMKPSHGHDNTIINGVSRIGYMSGGKVALWVDEDISTVLAAKAVKFIGDNQHKPFFMYFATHDIHVPRMPNKRFAGQTSMGPRGDAILELDWMTGEILQALKKYKLDENTIVIFTSDNGPVLNDGYQDQAEEKLNGHQPAGVLRGGKYSAFDGGTRVPLLISWPGHTAKGKSAAMVSQVDFMASFADLVGAPFKGGVYMDSHDDLNVLLGKSQTNRDYVVEHAVNNNLSIIKGDWKYIEPHAGFAVQPSTHIEMGNSLKPQLYNLKTDLGEKHDLADANPEKLKEMQDLLESVRSH